MIKVFSASDKIYTSNGDIVLQCTKAKVHKQLNGDFYIDIEAPLTYIDYLVSNNIIVAPTPQGEQAFRINNIDKTQNKIKFKAYHVFYDTKNYMVIDPSSDDLSVRVELKDCNYALDHFNSNTDNPSPFTTLSNITNEETLYCVRSSLYDVIQQVLERWGGWLIRDNWNIKVMSPTVVDNGITIRYGKNLKDIQATYNWDNVVTKLLPVGKDGIMLNALDPENDLYVYSDYQYEIPYTKTVSFNQDINEEDFNTEQEYKQALLDDLLLQAQNYVAENYLPQVNYTLKANVEKVSDVGDYIQVIDERINETFWTWVISYDYDCILEQYTQLQFGNFQQSLNKLLSNITNQTNSLINENTSNLVITLNEELQQAQDKIWNALGSSYVIYEGDKILIVDTLPKEEATNVIMINNGGIAFSNSGINGEFTSAWTIDNVLNMEAINVINLTANLIKGGTLKLGSNLNQNGVLEVYDEANTLIASLDKTGLKMYGNDGSYILMNNEVGFVGYDKNNNPIYWVYKDEFHQKKSVVEEEITLCSKMRFIPISISGSDGIGLVGVIQSNTTALYSPTVSYEDIGDGDYNVLVSNPNSKDAILYYKKNGDTSYSSDTINANSSINIGTHTSGDSGHCYLAIKNKKSNAVVWNV